jgi:hypothetical protein
MPCPYTIAAIASLALLQGPTIPLDSGWQLSGEGSRIEEFRGAPAILMRTGTAVRPDVALRDGTLEFDVWMVPGRTFIYVHFRMASEEEHEEIYFRPHKATLPDAVQYSPVWNGDSNWQLWHGPGGTAAVPFPRDDWMHVRIVMQGRRAALFLGGSSTPAMLITLGREPAAGHIGFGAFTPRGGAPDGPVAAIRNVVVRPDNVPYAFAPDSGSRIPAGLVRQFQLSPPVQLEEEPINSLGETRLRGREQWRSYATEPNGVLVIGRHLKRPSPLAGAIARLVVRAERDTVQPMRLGFSDYITVFVNGRPLFSGDAHYSFDVPRQEGLIALSQATAWLPLRRGDNEILLAVSDGFGGWGLMAQLDPAPGVRVVAAQP